MWHPKNFDLVLLIKSLPGNKTFPFVLIYPLDLCGFLPQVETFQKDCWICILSIIKQFFISDFKFARFVFSELRSFKVISLNLEPVLHYNHLINAFKFPTKIWGCHVMFPNHFYAKIPFGHGRFWALHQLFQSGPVGIFALPPI